MKEEEPTILDREEKNKAEEAASSEKGILYLGESSELIDVTEKTFEVNIPEVVTDFLKVKAGDSLQFIRDESNKKIYIEKAQE